MGTVAKIQATRQEGVDALNMTVQRLICRRLCLLILLRRAPDPANEGLHNQLMSWIRAVLFRST